MCSDDPFNDGVSNFVVDRLVVSTTYEELILREERERKIVMTVSQPSQESFIVQRYKVCLLWLSGATLQLTG